MVSEVEQAKQHALESLQKAMDYISSHEGDSFTGLFLCYHVEGEGDVTAAHTCECASLYGKVRLAVLELEQELLAARIQKG